jgi:hypothetical protein
MTHRIVASYYEAALSSQQYFVGNPLDRSCLTGNKKDTALLATVFAEETTKCLICSQQFDRGMSKLIV